MHTCRATKLYSIFSGEEDGGGQGEKKKGRRTQEVPPVAVPTHGRHDRAATLRAHLASTFLNLASSRLEYSSISLVACSKTARFCSISSICARYGSNDVSAKRAAAAAARPRTGGSATTVRPRAAGRMTYTFRVASPSPC